MKNLAGEIGRGYTRSLVITLISIAIVIPSMCLCVFFPLYLVNSQDYPIWILIVSSSLMFLAYTGGGIGFLYYSYAQRKKRLDAIFTPLGLQGKLYQTFFRQYQGIVDGKNIRVYFYRGPVLEIEVETPLRTRFSASQTGSVAAARMFGNEPLKLEGLDLGEMKVFGADETWVREFLSQPGVTTLLRDLTTPEDFFVYQHVVLRPGKMYLYFAGNRNLFKNEIPPEKASRWVDGLLQLVSLAESSPAPMKIDEESSLEQAADRMKRAPAGRTWTIIAVMIVSMLACFGAVFVIAFLFAKYWG